MSLSEDIPDEDDEPVISDDHEEPESEDEDVRVRWFRVWGSGRRVQGTRDPKPLGFKGLQCAGSCQGFSGDMEASNDFTG